MNSADSADIIKLQTGDALLVVDMQNDFLAGGRLPVPEGDMIIPVIDGYIGLFLQRGLPIYASRDWHPPDHDSFVPQGGPWPIHCVADSNGADFPAALFLPEMVQIVSKGTEKTLDGYSAFAATALHSHLEHARVKRLFVCGLATDYCVLETVRDALQYHYRVYLLLDAVRAVNAKSGDGENAVLEMLADGAEPLTQEMIV